MARVIVGVGSNIERELHVLHALQRLDEAVAVVGVSTFYVTQALERPADTPFVNGVVELTDAMPPEALKALLRRIEQAEGRQPNPDRFAPRPIDLDLLLRGDGVRLRRAALPHPDVVSRRFVALPLLELAPNLALPGSSPHLSDTGPGGACAPVPALRVRWGHWSDRPSSGLRSADPQHGHRS